VLANLNQRLGLSQRRLREVNQRQRREVDPAQNWVRRMSSWAMRSRLDFWMSRYPEHLARHAEVASHNEDQVRFPGRPMKGLRTQDSIQRTRREHQSYKSLGFLHELFLGMSCLSTSSSRFKSSTKWSHSVPSRFGEEDSLVQRRKLAVLVLRKE